MANSFGSFIKKLDPRQLYLKYFSSIAFLPSVISLFFIALAFILMELDEEGIGALILNNVPYLATHQEDTVVSLLATLIGGMFSLMVFSFSMVMIILTTATSNFSPRVVPGLIGKKGHQVVLGLYLGTIAYLMIILINVGKDLFRDEVPDLAVLVGILSVMGSLVAFIYFIHSISQSIQAGSIIHTVYEKTQKQLLKESKAVFTHQAPVMQGWQLIENPRTAYFQGINEDRALEFSITHDLQMVMIPEKGRFLMKGAPLAWISKPVPDEAVKELHQQIDYYFQEHIAINYLFGFKHLTEVAVKALSPGINDPGTALNAIDYLTELFCQLLNIGRYKQVEDENGKIRLYYRQAYFEKVFYYAFSSIRNYASKDVVVQAKLLFMLDVLQQNTTSASHQELFIKERKALMENARQGLENARDLDALIDSFD